MMSDVKEQVRPVYMELQGYLWQVPKSKLAKLSLTDNYRAAIEELNKITEKNFDRFKVKGEKYVGEGEMVDTATYQTNLGGLINRLHAEYFQDEQPPLSSASGTTFNINQNQAMHVQMLFDVRNKIDEKIEQYEKGTREKEFLKNVKDMLSGVKNINELLTLILRTAEKLGLSLSQIGNIFS